MVRHSRSGLVYEIESDELEWDVEGGDEGQMGGRNRWYAEVQHNELGTLVWSLWEYPVGAEEYQDQDLNGHVLVKDFDIYLAHDPDGPGSCRNTGTQPMTFPIIREKAVISGTMAGPIRRTRNLGANSSRSLATMPLKRLPARSRSTA